MAVDYKALKDGGFMRQKQKDHFSLRLKVIGGNVTAAHLQAIAAAAEKYGAGHIHLTSRQSVEIPFVKLQDVENIKRELAAAGVQTGVCGARVRTVTACQGSDVCPSGCIDTLAVAKVLDARYEGKELPHKFKLGVTGCPNNCLKAEENDVGIKGGYAVNWLPEPCTMCGVCIKTCRRGALTIADGKVNRDTSACNGCGKCVKSCPFGAWEGKSGYMVSFGGLFGNHIVKGKNLLPLIHERETLLRVTDAAVNFFAEHGRPGERFKFAVDRAGWERFAQEMQQAYRGEAVFHTQAEA